MELKPPKFELEIEKIRLSKTFLARTKKLANQLSQPLFNTMLQKLAYAITRLYGYGVGKFLEHGIK